jgi:hypothetical protein
MSAAAPAWTVEALPSGGRHAVQSGGKAMMWLRISAMVARGVVNSRDGGKTVCHGVKAWQAPGGKREKGSSVPGC